MERDSKPCALNNGATYQQWLVERVKKVKLPFKLISSNPIREELVAKEEPKKLTQLKREVEKLKCKKIGLNNNLYDLHHIYASLKIDHEGVVKKQKEERKYTLWLKQDLVATNVELSMRASGRSYIMAFKGISKKH